MRNKIAVLIIAGYSVCAAAAGSAAPPDLCREYAVSGKYDRAIEECTKQIYGEVPVKYPEYSFNNRGAAFADKQQYDHAIADYNKAIELNPKYATAYYNRAVAHAKKKNFKRALADFSKAIELNPQYTAAQEGRRQVLDELRRAEQPAHAAKKTVETVRPALPDEKKPVEIIQASASVEKQSDEVGPLPQDDVAPAGSSSPAVTPAIPAVHPEKQALKKGYSVQLGVFRVEGNAAALAARFREKGYDAVIKEGTANDGGALHRVIVGAFENRQDAVKAAAEIRKKENIEAIAVPR